MTSIQYPLASSSWDEEEIKAIHSVIESGFFTMGEKVRQFEREFAQYVGTKHAVMVNSGSSANLIGCQAVLYHPEKLLKSGDTVIVPAVSWSTTFFPLHQCGFKLKFVDVDISTFNIDIQQVREAAKDPACKAIFAVNLLGRCCDYDALYEIAHQHNLIIMEDNCEGFGATFSQKQAGSFGIFGSFSFFFSHHLVTMEGGMIVTDDDYIYENALALRAHGWTREQPRNSHLQIDAPDFTKKFRFVLPGYNLRPLEMSGAIGSVQLKKAENIIRMRRRNARHFYEIFQDIDVIILPLYDDEASWFGYPLIVRVFTEEIRDEFARILMENGVEARPILCGNFLNNPVIEYLDHNVTSTMHVAETIDKQGLFFGAQDYDLYEHFIFIRKLLQGFLKKLIL